MNNYIKDAARLSSALFWTAVLAASVLLFSFVPALAQGGDVYSSPELRNLLTAKVDPLPTVPIAVPQLSSGSEVDKVISEKVPAVFQISQATGTDASPPKVAFFQIVAAHYFLRVRFLKIAARTDAAWRLYDHPVTKPVYIIYDPTKTGSDRFKIWDESEVGDMNQENLEDAIKEKLGVDPTRVSTQPITAANEHEIIFNYKPDYPNPAATATWITILFYTKDPIMNRVREELGLDRFFYIGRMRFGEVDLSMDGRRLSDIDRKRAR
jgi:hypothetical protein